MKPGLYFSEIISFDDKTNTKQVKFDGEDVGTIIIDKQSGLKTFRSTTITLDGLYRIASWIEDSFAKNVFSISKVQGGKNVYNLYMKTPNPIKDYRIKQLAEFLYRNKQIEELPF